jgi:transposase
MGQDRAAFSKRRSWQEARVDDRRVISGILHVIKSRYRSCDGPPEHGLPTTIYNRFVRWAKRGIWESFIYIENLGASLCADSLSVA